jgi:hypothetical protein
MKKRGAVIVDPADISTAGTLTTGVEDLLYEFKADLNKLRRNPAAVKVRSLAASSSSTAEP